ncbi:hypothetical protein [Actinomadura sp. K4S16]|uniref:hypothetical protein n=1 Tax=Actinomadura sp. K4S16 TaxID=1316147 RepID=UPI0011EE029A|nr:hypothetical protein [Actinomadura sp. K4S16]
MDLQPGQLGNLVEDTGGFGASPLSPYCRGVGFSPESDPRVLGVPKEVVDEAARTLGHARGSLQEFLGALPTTAQQGSFAAADATWVVLSDRQFRSARRRLLRRAQVNAQLALSNILNHVIAIERTLAGEPVLTWPSVSLSRIVHEGAVRTCRLFDPAASSEERIARIAAAWLDAARQQLTAAHDLDPRVVPESEQEWERAQRAARDAGLSIRYNDRRRPVAVVLGEVSVPFAVNVTDASRLTPGCPPAWYRISSAATHSTMWLLQQGAALNADGQPAILADPEAISASTLIVLGSFEALTETLGTYHGHDPSKAVATLQRRMAAVIQRQQHWREQMQRDLRAWTG